MPQLNHALEDLPLDAFDLDTTDIQVESLTTGHGITETSASCGPCSCSACNSCCSC